MAIHHDARHLLDDDGFEADVILGEVIGRGSMAMVLRATLRSSGRVVAVKLLQPKHMASPEIVNRFLREGELLQRLPSPHLPEVLAVGSTMSDQPYIVMTLLEGADLETRLTRGGPIAVRDAVRWLRQACDGLAIAHAEGIVHRDLKPSNLFLSQGHDGASTLTVLDFGIAKKAPERGLASTAPNLVMGTAYYMAPEQACAAVAVDARADVWALGVVLFELLTRELPFSGSSALEVLAAIMSKPTPKLGCVFGDLPDGLVEVLDRCLSKRAADRFASVEELSCALAPYESLPTSLGPVFVLPEGTVEPPLPAKSEPMLTRATRATPAVPREVNSPET